MLQRIYHVECATFCGCCTVALSVSGRLWATSLDMLCGQLSVSGTLLLYSAQYKTCVHVFTFYGDGFRFCLWTATLVCSPKQRRRLTTIRNWDTHKKFTLHISSHYRIQFMSRSSRYAPRSTQSWEMWFERVKSLEILKNVTNQLKKFGKEVLMFRCPYLSESMRTSTCSKFSSIISHHIV